ncbi:MAG: ArsI/CadI family heavy metal resistance metalloenzyme [Dongiaceae bacterium]
MKRLHVHLAVSDVAQSTQFYSMLFGAAPTVLKHDYAKWMLEDPRVNFAISRRGRAAGLDHFGIQVDDAAELAGVAGRLDQAGQSVFRQMATTCCYAKSDKAWVDDPQGIAWETFRTFGDSTVYGEDHVDAAGACCADNKCASDPADRAEPAVASKAAACCAPAA